MFSQDLQYSLDSSCMFFHRPSENKNVIQVDNYYTLHNEILEDVIHHCPEGGQTVSHTNKYHKGLKQTMVSMEGCLELISELDTYIVKSLSNVEFGEVLGSVKLRDKLRNQRERVLVLNCCGIKCLVVLNKIEKAILFLDEEHWSCYRGVRRPNTSGLQILFQEGIELLLFYQK